MSEWVEKEEVLNQINCWFTTGEYKYSNTTHYLNKRISSIKPKIKWISVKDKLPEKNTWVLCYVKWMIPVFEMERGIRKYSDVKKVFFDGRFRIGDSVTHWMPLPPKPESEDGVKGNCLKEASEGEWIVHFDDLFPEESTQECSICHAEQYLRYGDDDNYCPNCGAKMKQAEKG